VTALEYNKMLHEWFAAPYWSRMLAMATVRARNRLTNVQLRDEAADIEGRRKGK
jgi:hypothetical protein